MATDVDIISTNKKAFQCPRLVINIRILRLFFTHYSGLWFQLNRRKGLLIWGQFNHVSNRYYFWQNELLTIDRRPTNRPWHMDGALNWMKPRESMR